MLKLNATKRLSATARNSLHRKLRQAAFLLIASLAFTQAQAQLSGTYTIGGSGADFSSFTKAIDSLNQVGVSGPVEFNVAAGTYTEQLQIQSISGASSTNTITFTGVGTSASGTLLTYAVTNFGEAVLELNSASDVIFNNIHIQQTDCNGGRHTVNLKSTSNIVFNKCFIEAPDPITCSNISNEWGINALYLESTSNSIFKSNRISGGTETIQGSYWSGGGYEVFDKNSIVNSFYTSVTFYDAENITFTHNTIDSAFYNSNSAMNISNCSGMKIAYNTITGYNVASAMSFYDINTRSNTTPTEVYNNLINIRSINMYNGIEIYYWTSTPTHVDFIFAHNTINASRAENNDVLHIESQAVSGLQILNNNITRTKQGIVFSNVYPKSEDKVDGNNFYNGNNGDLVKLGRNVYSDIADYKVAAAAYGQGLYDQSMAVTYKSATDLHISQSTAAPWGPSTMYSDDIDGNTRCTSFATAGADESFYSGNANYMSPSTPSFTSPSAVYYKNPVVFENNATPGLAEKYQWYVNNVFVSDSVHFAAALVGPKDTIKLVAYNCGGKDSSQTIITVNTPTAVPVTDFISSKSTIKQGETIELLDISSNYPSEWEWAITPKEVFKNEAMVPAYEFVYGDETSQNLYVHFLYGGKFNVCLTASNVVGAGNQQCISNYVEVVPSANLGSGTTKLTDAEGYIYDNGGPNKPYDYSSPFTDKMVIGDCADSVYLVFKKFDVGCDQNYGDYVRVFEGTNNRGRPLHCTNNQSPWGSPGPGFSGSVGSSCANACVPLTTDTLKAKGNMYIEMEPNSSNSYDGFEAYYWIKPKVQSPPVAKFSSIDSVCINSPISFKNESTGDDIKYLWDADDDGFYEPLGDNISWMYFADGVYKVHMIAMNCGGADTFTKEVKVFLPSSPTVQFTADNTNPTLDEVVFLTADVVQCVDDYAWTFTPASGKGKVLYVNGTSGGSANPNVMFSDTGCYSVQLHVANSNGEDELKLSCFIHVKGSYCKPAVKTLSQDVGISEVVFGNFVNTSGQGETAYSNYVNNASKAIYTEQGVSYNVSVKRNSTKHKVNRTIWIDWNFDGTFDASEKVAEDLNNDAKEWATTITIPASQNVGAAIMRVAINQGSYSNKVCGKNEFGEYEDYRLYIRPDVTKPVITLLGDTTIELEQGNTYTDAGATALDNHDGDLTSQITVTEPISGYNMIPGIYFFHYNVTDAANNDAIEVLRKVIVSADKTAPEIVLAGGDTAEFIVFSSSIYTPPAILTANDLVDGDVTGLVNIDNPVNTGVVDTYLVTYTVTDMSKNTAKKVVTVIVKDTTRPVITIAGDNPKYINVGDNYVDAGVTMTDNYYSTASLNSALQISNNVNVNVPGTYEYVYNVTDGSGNAAQTVKRTVIVGDMVPPVVSIIGDTMMVMEVKTKFVDPGFVATDNYTTNLTKQISGDFYTNFPNGIPTQLDTFHIVYTATDMGNNTVSETRYIVVKDQTEPEISLKGNPNATVCRWGTYTDAGYDVEDNFYTGSDITISTEGDWSATNGSDIEGLYSLRYKAVDKSGNIGYSDWRTIWVRSPYEFPCSTSLGIGDAKGFEKAISIYPNPNSGKFTVQADMPKSEKLKITVTNLMGQEIAVITDEMLNDHKFQVDLSAQPAGVYMLTFSTDHLTTTKRIVISK